MSALEAVRVDGNEADDDRGSGIPREAEDLSDEDIVERVKAGETALFEIIVRRYNTRLYRVAYGILNNDAEAEEVMQDTYVRAFHKLEQFAGRARFSTWLTKIAAYTASARRRKRGRTVSFDGLAADGSSPQSSIGPARAQPSPEEELRGGELRALLRAAIEELPETYRVVFVLRDVEGLDTAETADCLGISAGSVKVRLHRARRRLRGSIQRRLETDAATLFEFHRPRCDRMVALVMERIRAD